MPACALAAATLIRLGGLVVLVKKKKPIIFRTAEIQPLYWRLPGGSGEPSEYPKQCAWREILEETGLRIPLELLNEFWIARKHDGHRQHFYQARLPLHPWINGLLKETEHEIVGLFTPKYAEAIDMMPLHRAMMDAMLEANP